MQPKNPGEVFLQDVCSQEVTLIFLVLVTAWARGRVSDLDQDALEPSSSDSDPNSEAKIKSSFGKKICEESIVSIISLAALVIASWYKTCHVEKKTITGVHDLSFMSSVLQTCCTPKAKLFLQPPMSSTRNWIYYRHPQNLASTKKHAWR